MLAWAHDPTRPNHAFDLVNPRIQAIRLPTNCGTRENAGRREWRCEDSAPVNVPRHGPLVLVGLWHLHERNLDEGTDNGVGTRLCALSVSLPT